ncbi:pentatricopeptide repeat-containing protein At4g02750 [Quercus suber]|uniref:pentatricopeptide repeat-containing protein At4g02750 n=1 Tax=Quercus suber TaxID=58331 RepID=UPI000CE2367D|nr:pentatricopeptide repeat-containing protein At4g02750-like [Quercus suber]
MIIRRFFHFRSFSTLSPLQKTHLFQCNKSILDLSKLGRVTEARHLFDSMPHRDPGSWNSMISGYTQNGLLHEAQTLFNAFQGKNVRTWTILLTGYSKFGLVDEARDLFEAMPERNVVSWNAMISAYVQNSDLRSARKLFDVMPERNVVSWNSMITGYCHCGMTREAYELFEEMGERNSVSWMVMVSGFIEISEYVEAWGVFLMMVRSGVRPDQAVLVVALSAVMKLNDVELVETLRTLAIKTGYEGDVVVGTAILDAYTRIGSLDYAVKFFEMMPERNEYSWTTMISAFAQCHSLDNAIAFYERDPVKGVATRATVITAYAQKGMIYEARHVFDEIPNPNVVMRNAMVAAYAQNGMIEEAKDIFLHIPVQNAASWAAMISGLVQNGHSREALELFAELHRSGNVPNHSSFTSALFACSNIGDVEVGRQIHSLTIKTRCQFNSFVGNGLISMYGKCKSMGDVSQVFSTMRVRDIVSWNSLISRLSQNYMLDDALKVFEKMPKRDVVSWTAIISAYEQAGQGDVAFKFFLEMLARGMSPNQLTLTSLLGACACLGAAKLGEQIHSLIYKLGINSCLSVCNALITMYFKCGSLDGLCAFEETPDQDIVTWNAVLCGCAQNGLGIEVIEIFEQMKASGIFPNEISFLGVLCACGHAGFVDKGWAYFNSMSKDYGITPLVCHYTCMVDLLGRAGQISEAEALIQNMPVKPDSVILEALLDACRIHRNMEVGQRIAERLFQIGAEGSGMYVLPSNVYASQGCD